MKRPKGFRYSEGTPGEWPRPRDHEEPGEREPSGEPEAPHVVAAQYIGGQSDETSAETVQLSSGTSARFDGFGELPALDDALDADAFDAQLGDGVAREYPAHDDAVGSGSGQADEADEGAEAGSWGDDEDAQPTVSIVPAGVSRFRGKAGAQLEAFSDRRAADAQYRDAKKEVRAAERGRKKRERHERLRFSQHQRQRRRVQLIALSAVSILVLSVLVGVFTPLMSVRVIEVRGADRVPEAEIIDALDGVKGMPLALVTDDAVHEKLEGLTLLQNFEVEKIPPHTLTVVVQERVPVVAVPQNEEVMLVDASGVRIDVVPQAERPEGIPLVRGVGTDFSSDAFTAMATVLSAMPDVTRNRITEISAETPQQVQVTLGSGVPVLWGDSANNARKSAVLEAMLTALGDVALQSIDVSSPDAPVYIPAG
ncbi:cell division protein FtsQ/DivIB [Leucobacter sp. UCMA 4100]|uniref:cell division protein FtsQ/DivIB n=1 Tax=Leucobacter sp. UCMA 4100 TaxID=2810534 RepID=UPI0022EA6106|nr:cell division protein FtsQ/DivIB [Leucobacter sp. UCMA 4100]MDA3148110.1 cell division protein FtsQ/DivIB [Leucobacter sp. UCMA 4100]